MQNLTAYIFPAFVLKYTGKETAVLNKHEIDFTKLLTTAGKILDIDISNFDTENNNYINDELKNQYLSYIFSCAFSDILKTKSEFDPEYISGFSMGLYAALYHAGSIDFETGLLLIRDVFNEVKQILSPRKYLMASVIGFEKPELELLCKSFESIEIVIQNGVFSFVVSGKEIEVINAMELFRNEGVIHTSAFNVHFSYHSKILSEYFNNFIEIALKYKIQKPAIPVISMVNQDILRSAGQIKNEIAFNVVNNLNFLETINTLIKFGVKNFIEIGADSSLLKSSKFIDGDFKFESVSKGKVI